MWIGLLLTANLAFSPIPRAGGDPKHPPAKPTAGAIATPARPTATIVVGMYNGRGVAPAGFVPAHDALAGADRLRVRVLSAAEFRPNDLGDVDVLVFMGGSGSRQGQALGDEGRSAVREFVAAGGGYVGVCAGAYLALQGSDEFHKLRLVAATHLTGDFWRRGQADLAVRTSAGLPTFALHYENGPIFAAVPTAGLNPYVPLVEYVGQIYSRRNGTGPGEMPGTPAILAAGFGSGRVLLFSPNPAMGGEAARHPELLVEAVAWAARAGKVPATLTAGQVFASLR